MTGGPTERLHDMASAWSVAASAWDVEALTALYAADAMLFGGREGHAVGHAELRAYFESYRGTILSACLVLGEQKLIETGGSSLLAQGFGMFDFILNTGPTRQRMRTTWALDWASGATLIRAHHFSPEPSAPPLGN